MPSNLHPNSTSTNHYPGERLGLPREGAGSLARFAPRLGALAVDWAIAVGLAIALFNYNPFAVSGAFIVLTWLCIWPLGGSIGHLLFGMRLNTVAGTAPGWWRPLVRQILIMLIIPAIVTDDDGRGMHDILTGLVLRRFVRRRG